MIKLLFLIGKHSKSFQKFYYKRTNKWLWGLIDYINTFPQTYPQPTSTSEDEEWAEIEEWLGDMLKSIYVQKLNKAEDFNCEQS